MAYEIYETDFRLVDTFQGTYVVPADVCDSDKAEDLLPYTEAMSVDNFYRIPCKTESCSSENPCGNCEDGERYDIEKRHGWVGRWTMPGYLDCSDWEYGDSEEEVSKSLREMYPEYGEEEDDDEEGIDEE